MDMGNAEKKPFANSLSFEDSDATALGPKILVIGVGGAGNNAVNQMIMDDVRGSEFVAVNTDAQVLNNSKADKRIIIGLKTTKGLGAGADPQVGLKAAEESRKELEATVQGADMIFVAAGMGGGTGTGAAPLIAELAKNTGALTIGIVTKPFQFEGPKRFKNATAGIKAIRKHLDSMIVVPNNRLLELIGKASVKDSFKEADNILKRCVQTVTGLITNNQALINLDFADVKTVMKDKGNVLFGIGVGKGENKAIEAANRAVVSPLLETEIVGALDAIINVTGGESMTLNEANDAVDIVRQATQNPSVNIIFGVEINNHIENEMIISIIATGFDERHGQGSTIVDETLKEKASLDAVPWEDNSIYKNHGSLSASPRHHKTSTRDLMNQYKDKIASQKYGYQTTPFEHDPAEHDQPDHNEKLANGDHDLPPFIETETNN